MRVAQANRNAEVYISSSSEEDEADGDSDYSPRTGSDGGNEDELRHGQSKNENRGTNDNAAKRRSSSPIVKQPAKRSKSVATAAPGVVHSSTSIDVADFSFPGLVKPFATRSSTDAAVATTVSKSPEQKSDALSKNCLRPVQSQHTTKAIGGPAAAKINQYGYNAKEFKKLIPEKQKWVKRKYEDFRRKIKEIYKGASREERRNASKAESAAFFSVFVDYGLTWEAYFSADSSQRSAIGAHYRTTYKSLKEARPDLTEEALHRTTREMASEHWANLTVSTKKQREAAVLENSQSVICELCSYSFATLSGLSGHFAKENHGWTAGESCPKCGASCGTFSSAVEFRAHCRNNHAVLCDQANDATSNGRMKILATTDHVRCPSCGSCVGRMQSHPEAQCLPRVFPALQPVVSRAASDDRNRAPEKCLCNAEGGRMVCDEWRNQVLLKATTSSEFALTLLKSERYVHFKQVIANLREGSSNQVYVLIEVCKPDEKISFNTFVAATFYVGLANAGCAQRSLTHLLSSLRCTDKDIKSRFHIQTRIKQAILGAGPRVLLVPLTTGGPDGTDFGSAAEIVELLAMLVIGMPNLVNTLAYTIKGGNKHDQRLVEMFEHAGEIISAILYSTWLNAFRDGNIIPPASFEVADIKTYERFAVDEGRKLYAESSMLLEEFLKQTSRAAASVSSERSSLSTCTKREEKLATSPALTTKPPPDTYKECQPSSSCQTKGKTTSSSSNWVQPNEVTVAKKLLRECRQNELNIQQVLYTVRAASAQSPRPASSLL